MTATGRQMTAEELLRLPDDGMRHELIDGVMTTMSPSGSRHTWIALRFGGRLDSFVTQHGLGRAFGADGGFLLRRRPDLLRAPDAAFVRQERVDVVGETDEYCPEPPDLAVEVVSPTDRPGEIARKVAQYLAHGTRMVIVVYPDTRSARVHRPDQPTLELGENDVIDGADVVPGWRLPLAELFV